MSDPSSKLGLSTYIRGQVRGRNFQGETYVKYGMHLGRGQLWCS